MVVRRSGLLVAVVTTLMLTGSVALAQGPAPQPLACATALASGMIAFDSTKAADLIGTFDVVMVDTTSLRGGMRQHAGKLTLMFQDSTPRRRASMAKRVQQKYIVGFFEAARPDSGDMWETMANRTADLPGAFWADGYLRLGSFGQKSGISLYPRAIAAGELRGMWTSHAGTAVIVDFTGEREPDEAGYFCAKRIG